MIVTQSQKQCNGKTASLAFELPPLVSGAAAPPVEAKLPEITFTIVSVTPEMARGWLPRNFVRNRIARPRRVERYKRLIADGDWRLTHQGIAFDRFGVLVDGQHRVLAISQMPEGTSVPLVVAVYNVNTLATTAIDTGASRTIADVLTLEGIAEREGAKRVSSIAQAIFQGLRRSTVSADPQQISDTYTLFKREIDWAAKRINGKHCIAPVAAAFAYAWPVDASHVEAFAESVLTGIGLGANTPELALHGYIQSGLAAKTVRLVRGDGTHRMEVFFKTLTAIRYRLAGKPMSRLQAPRGDDGTPLSMTYFIERRAALGLSTGL